MNTDEFLSSWENEFNKNTGDIKIKLKSGNIRNVISFLLCKESSVFATMLNNWKESIEKEIILDTFDDETVLYVLSWIYYRKPLELGTNNLDEKEDPAMHVNNWFEVMRFAEVYDMTRLKENMEREIINAINIFTVLEILKEAKSAENKTFCTEIKTKCLEFMLRTMVFYFDLTRTGIIKTCVDGILPVIIYPKLDKHVSLCCLHHGEKKKLATKLDQIHHTCTRDGLGIKFYCCQHRTIEEMSTGINQFVMDKRLKIVIDKCLGKINEWFAHLPKKSKNWLVDKLLKESASNLLGLDKNI